MTNLKRFYGCYCLFFVGGAISTFGCSGNEADSNGVGSGGMTVAAPGGGLAVGGSGTAFTTPPYSYTPDATSSVQAAVQSGAGPH